MGILTLDEMRTEVGSALGNREGILDSRIDTWLNMAYFDVSSGIEFVELEDEFNLSTAGATYEYAGPVAPLVLLLARDDSTEKLLTKVSLAEFYRLDRTDAGALTQWAQRGHRSCIIQLLREWWRLRSTTARLRRSWWLMETSRFWPATWT